MMPSASIPLENVSTHQCSFSRGYWLGYAKSKAESRQTFDCRIPAVYVDDLTDVFGADIYVCVTHTEMGRFSVEMANVRVAFPGHE